MSCEYDISVLADNGLRRGRTTGTCATAAVTAALLMLTKGESAEVISVTLPNSEFYLPVPISAVSMLGDGSARADVIKDAGDDPDQTHMCTIYAVVKLNGTGTTRILAAPGVGTVTQPGIRVPVGEPAINPGPRQMILSAVSQLLDGDADPGFDIAIGCVDGEEIAKKTFNPRLGIHGGISILGTTGIVEPMSLAAYQAAIEVYIRVALGERPAQIAFMPGNIGLKFARESLHLQQKEIVHISNFIGFSLESVTKILLEENLQLETLWILGHPGKLAKLLEGHMDTHSRSSNMAMSAVAEVAADLDFEPDLVSLIRSANTVEAIVNMVDRPELATKLWSEIEDLVGAILQKLVAGAKRVNVRLFSMTGESLGQAALEDERR